MKYTKNKVDARSHIHHFNIRIKISLNGRKKLEYYLSMPDLDTTMYKDETKITYISFTVCKVLTVEAMLFYVNTGALYSCIG